MTISRKINASFLMVAIILLIFLCLNIVFFFYNYSHYHSKQVTITKDMPCPVNNLNQTNTPSFDNISVATDTEICKACLDEYSFPFRDIAYNEKWSQNSSSYETYTPSGIYIDIKMPGKITNISDGIGAGGPYNTFLSEDPATWVYKVTIEKLSSDINSDKVLAYLNEDYGYQYDLLDKFNLETVALDQDAEVFMLLNKADYAYPDITSYSLYSAIFIPSSGELIRILGPQEQANMISGNDTQTKVSAFIDKNEAIFKSIIQKIQIGFSSE